MNESGYELVCVHCHSVNRVPDSRLEDQPRCGKCKRALLPGHPLDLTDAGFDKFVARTTIPVVIDFWAPWCPPCRQLGPEFAAAAKQLSPRFVFAKLNTEEYPGAAEGLNVSGIPCLIVFKNGTEIARRAGAMSSDQILQWVETI